MLTFTPDSKYILASCWDECLHFISATTGDIVRKYQLTQKSYGVANSRSGRFFASATRYGNVLLINAQSGSERELKGGHSGYAYCVAISNDEQTEGVEFDIDSGHEGTHPGEYTPPFDSQRGHRFPMRTAAKQH